jgi:hypothetical protein
MYSHVEYAYGLNRDNRWQPRLQRQSDLYGAYTGGVCLRFWTNRLAEALTA